MRLFYHADSDSLFWSEEWPDDRQCDDVTDLSAYQDKAAERGLKAPRKITSVMEAAGTPDTGGMAGAITKSYKAWDRKPADLYPTPFDVTESLMPVIKAMGIKRIWEPACGDLDMTRVLEWHGLEVTSTDIRETGQGIGGFDFLNDDPLQKWGWEPTPDMIVTNPPFKYAVQFIEKALSYTPNVAMLLKIDYWNAVSRLPLFESNRPTFFFPLTWRPAFLAKERGNSPLMNCAWVVWTSESGYDHCIFEPIRKVRYAGSHEDGLRTSMGKLCQAVTDLTEVISR